MTLEELQAEFPIGSKWLAGPYSMPVVVCGWSPERLEGVPASHGGYPRVECWDIAEHGTYRNSWEPSDLRPLPVPCPITEPVTLRPFEVRRLRLDQRVYVQDEWDVPLRGLVGPAVTLHPAEPGATEGRYTWADTQ